MADKGILSQVGGKYNVNLCEYIITSVSYIPDLPTQNKPATGIFKDDVNFKNYCPPIGSICQVIESNNLRIFILSDTGWNEI